MIDYAHYEAISFDCYGTLIDWEDGIASWARGWLERSGANISIATFLDGFSKYERAVQSEQPTLTYPMVLAEVLRRVGRAEGLSVSDADAEAFGGSVGDWPAFADSTPALRALSERYKLVILSNVDRRSFARSNERLQVRFSAIITAEDVGAYKPSTANFDTLLATIDGMGIAKHRLLHVGESLYHDILPANRDQIDCVWIDRSSARGGPRASGSQPQDAEPLATYTSMEDFAKAALTS